MTNNIKPCWWGSTVWQTIYFMVAAYPNEPDKEYTYSIKCFLKSLIYLLPCEGCRKSYTQFLSETDTNIENDNNFKTKDNLIVFIFNLRNKVNFKLAHNYGIELNYFKKKITHMVINDNYNYDGRVCGMIEAPFISPDLEIMVFNYLKTYTSYDYNYTKKLLEISKKFTKNPIFDYNNKFFKFMYKRHRICRKIIAKIYLKVHEGKYDIVQSFLNYDKKLHELLFYYGCSLLHKDNLKTVLNYKISNNN